MPVKAIKSFAPSAAPVLVQTLEVDIRTEIGPGFDILAALRFVKRFIVGARFCGSSPKNLVNDLG